MNDRPDLVVTCQDADPLLASWAVAGVEANEHRALRRHLAGCAACRAAAAGYGRAADLLLLAVEDVEPPASLRSRLLAAVHGEASWAGATARQLEPCSGPWWTTLWRRIPSGRGVTAVAALVAAGAVGVAVVAVATRPASAPVPSQATVVHGCGLTPQPAACGTLRYDPTAKQAVLTVTGLPSVQVVGGRPQSSYEVWLVGADHSVTPAGFLTQSPRSRTYTAAMDADMTGVVALATTEEAFGGGDVPHGPQVLTLDIPGQS